MDDTHIILQPYPCEIELASPVKLGNKIITPFTATSCQASSPLFPFTFEETIERLKTLPLLDCEPDGAFWWHSPHGEHWQVTGNLYDRQDKLFYVELKSNAPGQPMGQFFSTFGPHENLLIQLPTLGLFLSTEEFLNRFLVKA
ncbi:MAG: hypothetical protein MPJ24_10500 [Pirellulaceae bacterium]|nr:hypothetical protein [Pirellulaceae bacterium]